MFYKVTGWEGEVNSLFSEWNKKYDLENFEL